MRVLYVENHARVAAIACRSFLACHTVTVVPSLQEARTLPTLHSFEAILLDYDLDDGKGVDLMPDLLRLPQRPIIIASSSHSTGNQALRSAGADAICAKADFNQIGNLLGGSRKD